MRKFLVWILILSMFICTCACMCACTEELTDKEKLYQEIIEMLEDEDYDGVRDLLDELEGIDDAESDDSDNLWDEFFSKDESSAWDDESSETEDLQGNVYIHNAEEFALIGASAECTYILACDIDLTGYTATIETMSSTLDGNGYSIYGVTQPLFAEIRGTVKNLHIADCNVEGVKAAPLALDNCGTIIGCTTSGTVSAVGENAFAGGLVCNNDGTIERCENYADVSARSYAINELGNLIHGSWALAGGICAGNSGKIDRCMNAGTISSMEANYISSSGGLVSGNTGGEVTNSYNVGKIMSDGHCAGIVGFSDMGKFVNCYNVGEAYSGLCGDNRDYIIDCYYLDSVSVDGSSSGLNVEGERFYSFGDAELCLESTFATFDFETVWVMTEDGPRLR